MGSEGEKGGSVPGGEEIADEGIQGILMGTAEGQNVSLALVVDVSDRRGYVGENLGRSAHKDDVGSSGGYKGQG